MPFVMTSVEHKVNVGEVFGLQHSLFAEENVLIGHFTYFVLDALSKFSNLLFRLQVGRLLRGI